MAPTDIFQRESELRGTEASNLIGALGEIIAWDYLRKEMGIWAYKIGSWNFFPKGYPHSSAKLDEEYSLLTMEQAAFVENKVQDGIIEYDFVGVKRTSELPRKVADVYLIEVKTGRAKAVRYYLGNSTRAFTSVSLEKARSVGFKVILVVVQLLDDWKYRITCRSI